MAQLFEVVTGPMEGMSYLVEEGTSLAIGRSSQNDITLPYDAWISSTHATIKCQDNTLLVMDLHSSNGSYMKGVKVAPNTFLALHEYLVLGSTLCRVSKLSTPLSRKPLAVKRSAAKTYLSNSLIREALRLARDRKSPTVSVVHLFMAALQLEHSELKRFLRSLHLEPERLMARLEKYRIFSGEHEWMNDFLVYQFKSKEDIGCFITPLVQDYFDRLATDPFDVISFIKRILREPYNILHPMLGLHGTEQEESIPGIMEKITLNPFSSEENQIILPKSFWGKFQEALDRKGTVLLSGSQGSGKTAILKHCFHALPKVEVAQFHSTEKRIFDPEIFLTFNEVTNFTPYLNRIIKLLRGQQLIAIDHFGFLLQVLERNHIEASPLISAIKRRHDSTIISVRQEHLSEVQAFFPKAIVVDLDIYLEKVKLDILKSMQLDFESEVRCPIGSEAKQFLKDNLINHYNMASIRAFFHFCAERVSTLGGMYRDEEIDKKDRAFSMAFFQSNLDHWASPFRSSSKHRHPGITVPGMPTPIKDLNDTGSKDEEVFANQVEKVVRNYLQSHMRTELVYEDGTRSQEEANDRVVAQDQLVTYLESLLACFGTGFQSWLESFLLEISPQRAEGSTDEERWSDFVTWFEELDKSFTREHFLEQSRKALKRALRQKTII